MVNLLKNNNNKVSCDFKTTTTKKLLFLFVFAEKQHSKTNHRGITFLFFFSFLSPKEFNNYLGELEGKGHEYAN